jgi:hypothetical protein
MNHAPAGATLDRDREMIESAFLARGGCVVLQGLFGVDALNALRQEAVEVGRRADRALSDGSGAEDWRGGDPARAYWAAPGGRVQWTLLSDSRMASTLSEVCGLRIQITGAASYSYYTETGDFLAVHRDVVRCDLALLTCLDEQASPQGARGALRLYPAYVQQPLSSLRAEKNRSGVDVPLAVGESALLVGGIVPHEVTPMAAGQRRTMSVSCFRLSE